MFTCPSAVTASLISLSLTAAEPVVIATEGEFHNYIFVSEGGDITGFDRDIADEICKRAELDCTWTFAPFADLIPGVMAGRFDMIIGGLAVTEDRLARIDFSQSYIEARQETAYVGYPGSDPATDRVGVQRGTIYDNHLSKLGVNLTKYETSVELVEALVSHEVDLILSPLQAEVEYDLLNAKNMVYVGSEIVPDLGVAIGLCKGNDALKTRIDTAISAMFADGTIQRLTQTWFPDY